MHLVALVCPDASLSQRLSHFYDDALGISLHPAAPSASLDDIVAALPALDFAGAIVLDAKLQKRAFTLASRSNLDAQEASAADALTVTPGGLIAEYNLGLAISAALEELSWDPRGARVAILGEGPGARAVSRELASRGVNHLTLLANNRPNAEQTGRHLPAGTEVVARAFNDPLAHTLLERCDLLIRISAGLDVPSGLLGPHLSVIDLAPAEMTELRERALNLGALALGWRDVLAYQLSLSLNHILGSRLGPGSFLELLHRD